ncbi:MAG TPA: hypothetical protein VGF28_16470 [Thermoanaerobaculia bacterium]|jgi:hypothetical protein
MTTEAPRKDLERSRVAVLILFSVAFVPLFANMIAVLGNAAHSFQFAGLLVALLAILLRWKLNVGIATTAVAVLSAVLALFRSPEPFAYISYTGALLAACLLLHALIRALTGQRRPGGPFPRV